MGNTNRINLDGVLGIRTRGRSIVGADKTTELCSCYLLLQKPHSQEGFRLNLIQLYLEHSFDYELSGD